MVHFVGTRLPVAYIDVLVESFHGQTYDDFRRVGPSN